MRQEVVANMQRYAQRYWPLACLLLAIFASSSTVISSKAFVHTVSRVSPWQLTEEGFGIFWENWWWLFVKGWHATEFAIVFLALRHALQPRLPWIAASLTAAFAASDEIHQLWVPRRGGHVSDWLIDMLGVAMAFLLLWAVTKKHSHLTLRLGASSIALVVFLLALHYLALNPFL